MEKKTCKDCVWNKIGECGRYFCIFPQCIYRRMGVKKLGEREIVEERKIEKLCADIAENS